MAIDYVEIRDANRQIIGIVDTAISIIWHSVFFGVGDFEIYAQATPEHLNLLKEDNYVTRPNEKTIGIIESVQVTRSNQDGDVIIASGRFAKCLLERRFIYNLSGNFNKPTILKGNVEVNARKLVSDNAISCAFDSKRNIPILTLGALQGIQDTIIDEGGVATEIQVPCVNLLEYTDAFLYEYGLSAKIDFNDDTKKLEYVIRAGTDRSGSIIFSQEFDNLVQSDFILDTTAERNFALIGGEGEEVQRLYSSVGTAQGLARKELFVDGSSIAKKYKDGDVEKTYTDAEYIKLLQSQGKHDLFAYTLTENFSGTINVTFGNWVLDRDYFLGDLVTIQDNKINKYAVVRIVEITEVQDENGYMIDAKYE